jgi:diacylglycerol kinase family enzyme
MASRSTRTLLVANPTARSGKAAKVIDAAMHSLTRARLRPDFFATLPAGATVASLAERLEQGDIDRVIYLGGDGTFAEAAKGIILARERYGIDIPMGMLPMGTANDQGRSFGVKAGPRALETNVAIIAAGIEQWLDVGRVESLNEAGETIAQDLWFDSWGVGLSAQILSRRNRDKEVIAKVPILRRIYRDKLVYLRAGVSSFVRSMIRRERFAAEITIDGARHEYAALTDIVITGTILYGGDWIFANNSKPDDGKFELILMKGHADWARATIAGHKRNPVTDDDLAVLGLQRRVVPQGKDFEIRLFRPAGIAALDSQIDGEEFLYTDHYRIENLFHYLRIIVPEDPHWV